MPHDIRKTFSFNNLSRKIFFDTGGGNEIAFLISKNDGNDIGEEVTECSYDRL